MDDTVPNGAENGRVLALAAVAAGVVGGLLAALTGRRDTPPAKGQVTVSVSVPPGLAESARQIREDVGAAVSEQLARAAERGKQAQKSAKQGKKQKMKKRKAAAGGALAGVAATINPLHHDEPSPADKAKKTARKQVQQVSQQGADLTAQAKQRLDRLSHQTQGSLEDLRQHAADLTRTGAEKAQESARTLSQNAMDRRQEAKGNLQPRVESLKSTVAPQAKAIKETAGDRIEEFVAEGRERASRLFKDAETEVLPAVKQFASQALDSLEKLPETVSEELPGVRDKADQLKSTAASKGTDAQQQVAQLGTSAAAMQQQASEKTKQVATATSQGSKDVGATITWLALGGGLVYFVFLNDDQREQVNKMANKLFGRFVDTYRDIQGFDQEFA